MMFKLYAHHNQNGPIIRQKCQLTRIYYLIYIVPCIYVPDMHDYISKPSTAVAGSMPSMASIMRAVSRPSCSSDAR